MTDQEAATVKSLAVVVARLEERVNGLARSSGTADAQQVADLAARVDDLADALEQLADARGGGQPAVPSWFAVDDPDRASEMLVGLVPWVYRVVVPQLRQDRQDYREVVLPLCWMWHPERVEQLLALQRAWSDAYENEDARATAAVEWQERWLPGWQTEVKLIGWRGSRCEVPGHSKKTTDYSAKQVGRPVLEVIADRLGIAPAYARWWVDYRRGVDAGPVPGMPLEE